MKADKKTLLLLGTATAVALVLGASYMLLFFAMKNKTEATAKLSEKITELSGKEARVASSVSILKRENTKIEKLSTFFFKESEIVSFTKKIENLGIHSGVMLTIESIDRGLTEEAVPFLNFRIRATGEFAKIERLLLLLDSFPGKLGWKTVRIVRDTETKSIEGSPEWRAEIFLVAFNFID